MEHSKPPSTTDWLSQKSGVALSLGLAGTALVVLVLALTLWQVNITAHSLKERLLDQATQLAAALGWEDAETLAQTDLQQRAPTPDAVKRQLEGFSSLYEHLRIFTLIPRDGAFLFGPGSHDNTLQGQPYEARTQSLDTVLNTGQPLFSGKHDNGYGHHARALAPILHPRTGEVLLIVKVEIPAAVWNQFLRQTFLPGLIAAILLVALFAVIILRVLGPSRNQQEEQGAGIVFLVTLLIGLMLTGLGTLLAQQIGLQEQERSFERQASQHAQRLREVMQRASDDLHTLARFMEVHGAQGRMDFSDYVRPLIQRSPLQAYMWVPVVTPETRPFMEWEAQADGLTGFRLYEYDPLGGIRLVPEDSLKIHYPALYIEPPGKGWSTLGFDMGSQRHHRIALMRAVSTGRVIGTPPVPLLFQDQAPDDRGSLIFKRVETRTEPMMDGDLTAKGLVAAALLFQDALERVMGMHDVQGAQMLLQLVALDGDNSPTVVARHPGTHNGLEESAPAPVETPNFLPHQAVSLNRGSEMENLRINLVSSPFQRAYPLLEFDQTHALVAIPRKDFFDDHPVYGTWAVGLLGSIMSLLAAFMAFMLRSRQLSVDRLVELRTRELEASRAQAEKANQAKSEFLSRMSHELRTPLNGVLGFSQLLEADPELNEEQRENVLEILHAGRHLLRLIDEILDLSRIEAGRIQISLSPQSLDSLFDECAALMVPLAAEHQVRLHRTQATRLYVQADPLRLKQVVLNLLSNAIKYNIPQGEVWLHAEADRTQGTVHIRVTDSGRGIPPERIDTLFQSFIRLHEREAPEIKGTGIGLAICRHLVELMHGHIGATHHKPQGSIFWIELPMAEPQEESAPEAARPGAVDRA
ncbi:Signal transduction histidine kinase [Ectothiorhodospira magna]|uniref:histidine kinase n=1 Tax=Ectothiorhodospira magna TaxID=867345 RepID=A0A1H9BVH0_9GAMM|nr:ATP-binding protein [Ectothiorhodospira magna]SEP92847.1 Signal transduction histidine kinase [Ectothiorhodospira magna]